MTYVVFVRLIAYHTKSLCSVLRIRCGHLGAASQSDSRAMASESGNTTSSHVRANGR